MAKQVTAIVKLQCPGGQATPAPPVGPALGAHGVNIGMFVKQFNDKTANAKGMMTPVVITVYSDRSFEFAIKSPPAAPAAAPEAAAPAAQPAESGAATATAETATPKKKKAAGVPPRRGKKLRNHLKNQQQRLAKEGVMPVRKAIQSLKSIKRVKFD